MIAFQTFWQRLKVELKSLPSKDGIHFGKVRKWSQKREFFDGEFVFLDRGGNVIDCATMKTDNSRPVSQAEFEKVYKVWTRYVSGSIPRTHIVHELGVQNATWIIQIFKHYESLMV